MLRLATYNIESLGERHGAPPLPARIAVLRPRLSTLAGDVICLQEVDGQHPAKHAPREPISLRRVLERTPYAAFALAASGPEDGTGMADRHNLVTLSRLPITATRSVRHQYVNEPRIAVQRLGDLVARFDRPLQYCAIELDGGGALHLINLHLRAPLAVPVADEKAASGEWRSTSGWAAGYQLAAMKRSAQALEARLLVDSLLERDSTALIAVCGDFNATLAETPLRLLMARPEDVETPALARHALTSLAERVPLQHRFSVRHRGRPMLVDHILASAALAERCRGVEIHNQGLIDEAAAEQLGSSFTDSTHAPIVATFDLG